MSQPVIQHFHHVPTSTFSYVVYDPQTRRCAIIDPVLDFDYKPARTSTEFSDQEIAFIEKERLTVDWILETHAHADHLSGSAYLKGKVGGKVAIGEHVRTVQGVFKELYNLPADFPTDGSQFDHLFKDGEVFHIGNVEGRVLHTPGHTPACVTYVIGDNAFVGDTLFMPDYGTARCDFPGGNAKTMYQSIQRILSLPPETRLYMCHDYLPDAPGPRHVTTVQEEKDKNPIIHSGVTEAQYVEQRNAKDATLEAPVLILPSLQVNIRAGNLPPPEDNGIRYLKIPLNQLGAKR